MEENRGGHNPLVHGINKVVSTKALVKSGDNNNDAGNTPGKLAAFFKLFLACSVCGGIHYGWGLQISLLTPYAMLLGIPHMFASLICSSGPFTGLLVNPTLSYFSARCTMRMGRRRPFILFGCLLICISVLLVGFSEDMGHHLGDSKEHCGKYRDVRKGAAILLGIGFYLLDVSNNAIQGMTRALIADISEGNIHGPHIASVIYSIWGGIGVTLGYTAGATEKWPEWFPWLKTKTCCGICVSMKGAFLTSVVLIVISMTLTMIFAEEKRIEKKDVDTFSGVHFSNPFKSIKNMPPSTTKLFIVTGVSWIALYPFFVYSTDWMGREIFHGLPQGRKVEVQRYYNGVRMGCIGLILCAICRMFTTILIPKLCQKLTSKVLWCLSNFTLFILMTTTVIISVLSKKEYEVAVSSNGHPKPNLVFTYIALSIFALMGIATSITLSLPLLLASQIFAAEGGGSHISAITIAIVLPQTITVLTTGPLDNIFGHGGNIPGFGLGAIMSFVSWVLGLLLLS